MMGGQFDVTHQIPLQFIEQVQGRAQCCRCRRRSRTSSSCTTASRSTGRWSSDPRVREAMNIAINRAEIVKGIMLGNAEPAYTFIDPEALDFARVDQAASSRRTSSGRRSCSTRPAGRSAPTASARRTASSSRPRSISRRSRISARVSEAIQGYMRKIGVDWKPHGLRLDHRACQDGRAGLRVWTVTVPLHVGRRSAELLLRLQEHPGAQPDELEGRRRPTSG